MKENRMNEKEPLDILKESIKIVYSFEESDKCIMCFYDSEDTILSELVIPFVKFEQLVSYVIDNCPQITIYTIDNQIVIPSTQKLYENLYS